MDPKTAVQYLFELPKFDAQKEFCRSLLALDEHHGLLAEVVAQWHTIPPNRRDKFFYLVSLLLPRVDYDVLDIGDTELRNYCIKCSFRLDERMVRYVAACRPSSTLLVIREGLRDVDVNRGLGLLALELGKRRDVHQKNREVLYAIYARATKEVHVDGR